MEEKLFDNSDTDKVTDGIAECEGTSGLSGYENRADGKCDTDGVSDVNVENSTYSGRDTSVESNADVRSAAHGESDAADESGASSELDADGENANDTEDASNYNMALLEKDLLEAFFPETKNEKADVRYADNAQGDTDERGGDAAAEFAPEENDCKHSIDTASEDSEEELSDNNATEAKADCTFIPNGTDEQLQENAAIQDGDTIECDPDAYTADGTDETAEDTTDTDTASDTVSVENTDTEEIEVHDEFDLIAEDAEDAEDAEYSEFASGVPTASAEPKKERRIDAFFDIFELFIFSLVAVLVITTFLFRHAVVKGSSMQNTLFEGEHLIISDFMYTPARGDIIVCDDPTTPLPDPIVKRIIAVGGDRIQITYSNHVYVNGTLLNEEYIISDKPIEDHDDHERYYIDIVVPEGELFVMGDNRDVSTDSRDERVGTISEDSVLGKVLIRFYPLNKFGTVN